MTMPKITRKISRTITRRQFAAGAGAGLLLPFVSSLLQRRPLRAAAPPRVKRLLLFCTMGTKPDLWSPTNVVGENSFTFTPATAPLAAHKDSIVLIEGLPSKNPDNGHGDPGAITGMGSEAGGVYYGSKIFKSLDQFASDGLAAAGINRPIATLLLGSDTAPGGNSMFWRGNNILPIASPSSAYNTVFGAMVPTGTAPATLLRRRRSVVDLVRKEAQAMRARAGAVDRSKLDLHLDSIRQLENKLVRSGMVAGACSELSSVTDSTSAHPGVANDLVHMDIIVNAFACDVTRIAAIQFGADQKFEVDLPGLQGDQHSSFIHGSQTDFTNLTRFETFLAQQFAGLITKLKARPEPTDPSTSLYDNTLMVWARDMGDATLHNQRSMRFVLAGGAGYLKTHPNGRYLDLRAMGSTNGDKTGAPNRHERVLLSVLDAMGITDYRGFGDPDLAAAYKTPLPGLAA
ncbi:MAG TPA: DUF1552 domain-containing protein [Polyangia bacterium]|nr:DUF1552 domain-containing protein [Polyangia bacterium]